MSSKEVKPIESLNWMYHLHYIKGEFDQCEKQIDRTGYQSDYAHHLKGMIKLRKGETKDALNIFSEIKDYKAMTRCLVLLGQHQTVTDLVRDKSMYASPSDSAIWSLIGTSFLHQVRKSSTLNQLLSFFVPSGKPSTCSGCLSKGHSVNDSIGSLPSLGSSSLEGGRQQDCHPCSKKSK